MTNRNRRPPMRRPRRTSRKVWVNSQIDNILLVDTIVSIDLLSGVAQQFMLFDSTILGVVITDLSFTFDSEASASIRQMRWALETGKNTLDSADFQSLLASSIGPTWLHVGGATINLAAAAQSVSLDLLKGDSTLHVKAKRRFRENDATLWFIIENNLSAGDVNISVKGLFRTLLLVP